MYRRPAPVAVSRENALALLPKLQARSAELLRQMGNTALADLVASGDRSGPDKMATYEQNLPDSAWNTQAWNEFENLWRVLLAYQSVADGLSDDRADVFPWMIAEAERIGSLPATV